MTRQNSLQTSDLQRLDNQIIHPWEDFSAIGTNSRPIIVDGAGIFLADSNGNRFLDGPAGMWCVNVGYGRPEMGRAIAEQAEKLCYSSPWTHGAEPASMLAERLCAYAPGDLNHVFFTTCGSTAVDSALRLVFFYNNVLGRPEKKQIISRVGAYHGSTYLSASCSGKMLEKTHMDGADHLVHSVGMPKPSLRARGTTVEQFCDERIAELEAKILEVGPGRVAAFIAEPVMGAGGVIVPPAGYHAKTKAVCRKYDVLYISDEVVTAFGRLGHVFASESVFNVTPDILTTAKGLTSAYVPMGAMFVSDRIVAAIKAAAPTGTSLFNGYTYSGHPVTAAAALRNLDIIEQEGLLQHVRTIAPYFQDRLNSLTALPVVSEVRGVGLMAGIEFVIVPGDPSEERDYAFALAVDKECQKLGLLVRPIYNNAVMSPPLTITEPQIDMLVSTLRAGIERAMVNHGIAP